MLAVNSLCRQRGDTGISRDVFWPWFWKRRAHVAGAEQESLAWSASSKMLLGGGWAVSHLWELTDLYRQGASQQKVQGEVFSGLCGAVSSLCNRDSLLLFTKYLNFVLSKAAAQWAAWDTAVLFWEALPPYSPSRELVLSWYKLCFVLCWILFILVCSWFHLHRRFPLQYFMQKLIWGSWMLCRLGNKTWGLLVVHQEGVGPPGWERAAAEAFSNRVEALLLHPSSFWQGQERN